MDEKELDNIRKGIGEHEVRWIKSLRSQVNDLNTRIDAGEPGLDIYTHVNLSIPLGWCRTLLYILDLARGLQTPWSLTTSIEKEIADETYLLATGAMEG